MSHKNKGFAHILGQTYKEAKFFLDQHKASYVVVSQNGQNIFEDIKSLPKYTICLKIVDEKINSYFSV